MSKFRFKGEDFQSLVKNAHVKLLYRKGLMATRTIRLSYLSFSDRVNGRWHEKAVQYVRGIRCTPGAASVTVICHTDLYGKPWEMNLYTRDLRKVVDVFGNQLDLTLEVWVSQLMEADRCSA